jgi:signal transduction histidine kinase
LVETLLDAEDIDGATRRHFLERINSQTSRLVSLVADLLSLSRIEAGDAASERRPIDLRVPVLESVRALRGTSERRQVVLLTDLPSGPVVVLAEDEGLRQAISNLIDNAIKYSPEGSPVEVRLRTEGGSVVLEVADRGVGIPEEHQERIFERFYRVDPARSRELGGTGLGLAIVKNVALGLGGEVDVRSQPGRGSTFTVRLPLAPAPAPVFTESS